MLEEQFIEHMRSMNPRAKAGNPCAYPRERPSRSRPLHLPLGQCALPIVTDEEVKKQLHTLSEREYDTLRRFAQGQSCAQTSRQIWAFLSRLSRAIEPVFWGSSSTNHLIRYAVKHDAGMTRPPATDEPDLPRLSERECEVLAWFVTDARAKTSGRVWRFLPRRSKRITRASWTSSN